MNKKKSGSKTTFIIEQAKKNIVVALIISVLILVLIVLLTIDKRTIYAIKKMNIGFLLFSVLLTLSSYFLSGVAFKVLADALGDKISTWEGFEVFTGASFVNLTAPFFNIANLPVKIYFLTNFNIGYADATAIVATHAVLSIWFFLIAPLIILVSSLPLVGANLNVYLAGIIGVLLITVLFFAFIVKPLYFERLLKGIIINRFFKIFWTESRLKIFYFKTIRQVEILNKGLKHLFRQAPFAIFTALLIQFLSWIAIIATVPVILIGLNWIKFLPQIFLRVLILNFFISVAPTPGGSGVAEVGLVAFMVDLLPRYLIGPVVLIWRLITYYLIYILSALFFVILTNMRRKKNPDG